MEGQSFYEFIQSNAHYRNAIDNVDKELIQEIESTINSKFKFRPYQEQALMAFNWIINKCITNDSIASELVDESCGNVPVIGMELCTGSGKTLLIGAFVTYLHVKHNIKNFLILTPPRGKSAIYDKTIKNFDLNDRLCVLSNSLDKKFNLVTGENYTDKSSNYDADADFTIFVFNINKFFESASGVKNVDKAWEESFWKNPDGNIISFRDYLSGLNDLVIITDESHHFQKYSKTSGDAVASGQGNTAGDIVSSLKAKYLIEFTATMVAKQKPIFRFPVNEYISEGYGKKVRAWGISTNNESGLWQYDENVQDKQKEVTDADASRLVRAVAVHIIKKKALGYDKDDSDKSKKPILLVKARSTAHADNLYNYLVKEIPKKTDQIEQIYEAILRDSEYEINHLIKDNSTKESIISEIENIGDKAFSFHTANETKETLDLFTGLEENEMEVLIQVDKATEGWNIDNVYTILILANTPGDIKTNVKQLIGRGLRLLREKREYDDSDNKLLKEQEILHIVCDKGNNFAKFVEEIRNEIGLNSENFGEDYIEVPKQNKTTSEDMMKYNDLVVPIISRESESLISNPDELIGKLTYNHLGIDNFVTQISSPFTSIKENGKLLKWQEDEQSQERDYTTGMVVREGTSEYLEEEELVIGDVQRTKIVKEIIRNQNLLPSDEAVDDSLKEVLRELTDKYSFFFKRKYGTNTLWVNKFSKELISFISKKIDMYFTAKTTISGYSQFKEVFTEHNILIRQSGNNANNIKSKEQLHEYFETNRNKIPTFYATGYEKSYFHYSQFDSSQEAKFAELLEQCEDVELWVKNKRHGQLVMKYGLGNSFNPDFIVKLKDSNTIHILEIKGEVFNEASKEKKDVMRESNALAEGKFKNYFLLHTTIDTLYERSIGSFNEIIEVDDLSNDPQ
ncbi:DEAD/DEAH box helicase family protein [Candidatus Woesearchaeota archaeon]|nr:DEAD/DEAH box helicase family protein [Candidatus Woesearchaeota archaeon]